MEAEKVVLGAVDFFFIILMLLISGGIGVYFRFAGGKQRTTEEFLLAGKNMPILPVAFSIMATSFSANTLLGVPAEMYTFGTYIAFINVGNVIGLVTSAYLFLPVFFQVQVTTAYQYLEKRFGKKTRLINSFTFVPQMMLSLALVLYAPALALSAVTNISTWTSVITVGLVCTFYCSLGGMKAVLWTDVFQAILMYLCLFAVIVKGSLDAGGIANAFRIANEGGRLRFPGFEVDPRIRYTMWNVVLQGAVISMGAVSANQVQVQRLLTVKNIQKSRAALFLSIPMFLAFSLMCCLAGIIMYANLSKCDPLTSVEKPISSADMLLPYYIMQSLGHIPGLPGLCICGIFSAALSSVSSSVNSLTAVTMEDFVKPFCAAKKVAQWKVAMFAKAITLFYGLLCIALTFVVANLGSLIQASYTIYGMIAGPVLGVFLLGMLTRKANEKGVIIGLIASITLTAWISFGASSSAPPPKVLPLSTTGCLHLSTNDDFRSSSEVTFPVDGWISDKLESGLRSPSNFSVVEYISENTTNFMNDSIINTLVHTFPLQENRTVSFESSIFNSTDEVKGTERRYVFPLYTISYVWFVTIGFVASLLIGYLASISISLFEGKSSDPPLEYLSPLLAKFVRRAGGEKTMNKDKSGHQCENEVAKSFL